MFKQDRYEGTLKECDPALGTSCQPIKLDEPQWHESTCSINEGE